ncbi:hypothetical protein EDEG_01556 [Edhazardia aedis USNM 41457]|uniref:Uncharacterized protein n=1 Tax=Edhazardia aedis (strain USNM 41457) TaxID=1003232 RepID=J9DS76_EDHAE|nr:hypothetical protein EDEG_01556 [Edhazardia aedis USNM 41457]|eukprot:EJW04152.1 hypothetical protein EDEG_01556 [Edhazardia aedis USNM 41457]
MFCTFFNAKITQTIKNICVQCTQGCDEDQTINRDEKDRFEDRFNSITLIDEQSSCTIQNDSRINLFEKNDNYQKSKIGILQNYFETCSRRIHPTRQSKLNSHCEDEIKNDNLKKHDFATRQENPEIDKSTSIGANNNYYKHINYDIMYNYYYFYFLFLYSDMYFNGITNAVQEYKSHIDHLEKQLLKFYLPTQPNNMDSRNIIVFIQVWKSEIVFIKELISLYLSICNNPNLGNQNQTLLNIGRKISDRIENIEIYTLNCLESYDIPLEEKNQLLKFSLEIFHYFLPDNINELYKIICDLFSFCLID